MAKLFTASSIILLVCLVLMVVSAGPTNKKQEDLQTDEPDDVGDGDDEHDTTTSKPLTTPANKKDGNNKRVDGTTKKTAATTKKANEIKKNDNKKDLKKPAEVKKADPKKVDADPKKGANDKKKTEAKSNDNNKQKPDAKKLAATTKTPNAKSTAANAKSKADTKPNATPKPTAKSASNKPTAQKPSTNAKPNVPQDPLEQILKPLLKMVIIQDIKNQSSKAGSYKLESKKELNCLTENQRKSMRDVIKKCSDNSIKTKEANIQKVDHDFDESDPEDKQHTQHVKTMKHRVCVEKCFIRNMVANNGSNNSEIDTEKMKSLIQQVNLPDSQKQSAKTSLDQCMLNYTPNSTKLRGFLHRMAQDEDKMTNMLSKLVDQMLEKRNNETEIHELQELKEYIPLIKGMVCIVKSLTENGCKASAPNPVKLDAPKKGK